MFNKISRTVVKYPLIVVAIWLLVAGAITAFGPSFDVAASRQRFSNLPDSAESVQAAQLAATKFPAQDKRVTAIMVVVDNTGLQPRDSQLTATLTQWLRDSTHGPGHIASVSLALPSKDQKALVLQITFDSESENGLSHSFDAINTHLASLNLPTEQSVGLTGEAAFDHDELAGVFGSSGSGDNLGRLLSIAVVIIVLALVYRSPLAVFIPLLTIAAVLFVSPSVIAFFANTFDLPISSFSQTFVYVVVLGAGTNYGLFLINRYREELQHTAVRRDALADALIHVSESITSSAATVILAMSLMGFAQLGLIRTLGPSIAIAIAVMLLAGLTLLPALIALSGKAFFWPRRVPNLNVSSTKPTIWTLVGNLVTHYPRRIALGSTFLLLVLSFYLVNLNISFDVVQALPASKPSVQGLNLLKAHFGSSLTQTTVYLDAPNRNLHDATYQPTLQQLSHNLAQIPHVTGVTTNSNSYSQDASTVRFDLALNVEAYSNEAVSIVNTVDTVANNTLHGTPLANSRILVAGNSAEVRDQNLQFGNDFWLVGLFVAVAVFVVLALLVRSLIAPIYLLASIALSTMAAIGIVTLIYQEVVVLPIFYTTPLFAFVFLVALGEDFNILMMSRLREESRKHAKLSEAIINTISTTGGVISSCGLVMAASFGLLLRNPIVLVQQVGLVVVIGILLDTFLVRPILVPAVVELIGRWNWVWFSRRT